MSKIKARVDLTETPKEKKSLLVIIIAAVIAVAVVAGATIGILAACGVFSSDEGSNSSERTEYTGGDNEVNIEDILEGILP